MSDRRTLTSSLSALVIEYLLKEGHTQARIARMLGVSEGYISLVKSRERALTLDHVERLAEWMDVPLGALLLAVVPPPKNLTPEKKKLLDAMAKVIKKADEAQEAILRKHEWKPAAAPRRQKKPVARAR